MRARRGPLAGRFLLPPARLPAAVRLAQAALLLLWVAFAGSTVLTLLRPQPGPSLFWDSWCYDATIGLAGVLVLARAVMVVAERRAWAMLAAALLVWCAGEVVYALWVGDEDPLPTLADPLYLAFYPLAYLALVLLLRARTRRLPGTVASDGATSALALAAVAAAAVFGPVSADTGGSSLEVAVGLAYPLGDLLLVAVVGAALVVLGGRLERRWLLLAAAFGLFGVADSVYLIESASGSYVEGTWVDALWPLAGVLAARASWRPTRQLADRRLSTAATLLVPLACTLAAVAVLVMDHYRPVPGLAVLLAAGALLAVAVRLGLTIRETSALADSRRLAVTDELTGLANRRALIAALKGASARAGEGPGLLLIDLDRFKEINDSLGHHVGDELLRQLAARLARTVRPGHLLARLGGDEFAVVLPRGADASSAHDEAEALVATLSKPFPLDDVTLHMEASVGIALCPQHCEQPMQLLQRADVAMYAAKHSRSHVAVYQAAHDPHSRARLQTVEEMRRALALGELTCHYQPKVTVADGAVSSVEALVRWQHPTRGLLSPDEFLPLAEQTGLMRPLTAAVLDLALGQARRWRDEGTDLVVAVNLSVTNLLDSDLPTDVAAMLAAHGLPPSALMLEITESVLMADSARAKAVVDALHRLGVGLSIDDYGTGYSSLAYLQDLAVDELKLDRTFIARLADDARSAAIVRSTVELAHSLGLRLVAEGVEDGETLAMLRGYGCDVAQGYHHSRPLPADELTRWLAARARPVLVAAAE